MEHEDTALESIIIIIIIMIIYYTLAHSLFLSSFCCIYGLVSSYSDQVL